MKSFASYGRECRHILWVWLVVGVLPLVVVGGLWASGELVYRPVSLVLSEQEQGGGASGRAWLSEDYSFSIRVEAPLQASSSGALGPHVEIRQRATLAPVQDFGRPCFDHMATLIRVGFSQHNHQTQLIDGREPRRFTRCRCGGSEHSCVLTRQLNSGEVTIAAERLGAWTGAITVDVTRAGDAAYGQGILGFGFKLSAVWALCVLLLTMGVSMWTPRAAGTTES